MPGNSHSKVATTNRQYAVALGRAFAGAVIFSLPLLMTMEMWWLGHYLGPWMLLQFTLLNMVMLYGLSRVAGFEESHNKLDDLLDAFAAYAVAAIASALVLLLIGVITLDMPLREVAGKVAIQAVPASFGAMIGAKLMGEGEEVEAQETWRETYQGQLFMMAAGALFLSFTMAPTEEMILISFQMTPWHALVVVLVSIAALHAIIHLVGFPGQEQRAGASAKSEWLTHSLPGYGIAVVLSFYVLWTFGRTDGLDMSHNVMAVAILALPASIGAGIARVVV